MLIDELPSDDSFTDEENTDSGNEYTPDQGALDRPLDSSEDESENSDNNESAVNTEEAPSSEDNDIPYKREVTYLEQYIAKRPFGDYSKEELKKLQENLKKIGNKKLKMSVSKVESLLEVSRHGWKNKEAVQDEKLFSSPQGVRPGHFDPNKETPGTVFLKFVADDIIEDLLYQTNLYINQRGRRVTPITKPEFYGFLGMNIIMSYHVLPAIQDYWKTDADLGVPYVSSVMNRDRNRQILSNLHANDNTKIPDNNTDKLFKLRPFIQGLNINFVKLYDVAEIFSNDESIIRFKGRHSIKQYNPMKPIKRGYKLWMRADSDAYISKFDVYQGRAGQENNHEDDTSNFGLGEKVVVSLCNDVFNKNHRVFFDNYFVSLPLLEYLKAHGIQACGTIRSNRKGLPIDFFLDKKLARGESDIRVSKTGLAVFKWKDSKSILVASNFHGTELSKCSRTIHDGSKKEFDCPKATVDYNASMGGVDKADMLVAVHGRDRKSLKWWHRIFFGLIDRVMVNSQVVYCKLNDQQLSTLEFRRSVAQCLITMSQQPRVGRPLSVSPTPTQSKRRKHNFSVSKDVRLQNLGAHWVVPTEQRARCEVCSNAGVESRPKSQCSTCKVFLCCNQTKNCFNMYHGIPEVM